MFKKLFLIIVLIVVGIVVWWVWPRTRGTVTFVAADASIQTEQVQTCKAGFGSVPVLFGVHLMTDKGTDVFIHDSKLIPGIASRIELTRQGGALTTIDPTTCTKFTTALNWGEGNIYSDVRNHANGSISIQCPLAGGGQLQVEAGLRGCTLK